MRSPSRDSNIRIAKSRRPTAVERSQLPSSRATGLGVERLDQRRQPPLRDRRDGDGEFAIDQPLVVQETQQRPQPGDGGLRRPRASLTQRAQQVPVDRGHIQRPERQIAGGPLAISQKRARRVAVAAHRLERQPALNPQVLRVAVKPGQRRRFPRSRRWDDPESAQVPQQRNQRAGRRKLDPTRRAALLHEPLDLDLAQVARLKTVRRHPTAQMRHQLQLLGRRPWPIPAPEQLLEKAGREDQQRPGQLNPQRVAH
jgi:hypothetical protein